MVYHSLKGFRTSAGSLGGVAGANLVVLAMVISPVYAMLAMASVLKDCYQDLLLVILYRFK
ncbi:hypothetical protein [Bacillus toyonensis]|uniref:hypothetical protein n=1 Tax=Bacillus toyonensis TaxID=155322 RepID=UPI0020D27E8C|nr:hypothetical protein [Bacillus toyonensis]